MAFGNRDIKTAVKTSVATRQYGALGARKRCDRCGLGRVEDVNVTPKKIGPASTSTAPQIKRHIALHNDVRRVQSVGRRTKRSYAEYGGFEQSSWIKRKFYIVENDGKPMEVYCTDLIHRAKQHRQRQRLVTEDGHRFLRVVDKWREEWNHGVQMPLGTSKDCFRTEQTALFPGLKTSECFQLPTKMVSVDVPSDPINTNRYTNEEHFQFVAKPPNLYYNLDKEDTVWLKKRPNAVGRRPVEKRNIPPRTFVQVMNCLELLSYKNMHDALLEPFKNARDNSEDDAECCICRWPSWETGNQIVFCDGCNIAVHQVCYGIAAVPNGQWFCQLCTHFGRSTIKECLFCPVRGGAMKATKNLENWAHVVCALFIAEVRFGDAEKREPVTHISEVPAEKWRARCCVCDTRSGACIKCTHPKCDETFHVSCAQFANFVLDIENDERELNGVKFVSLCGKHSSRTQQQRNRHFRFNKDRLHEMLQHFEQYVDMKVVAAHLHVAAPIVERVYNYWMSKRNKNDKRPLIVEPEDSRSVAFGTAIPAVTVEPQQHHPREKGQKQRNSSKINNGDDHRTDGGGRKQRQNSGNAMVAQLAERMPRRQLFIKLDKIRRLRILSEKARNLCYMVTRREKLKKQCVELLEHQVKLTASNAFGRVPPVSSRSMERLLSEWREAANLNKTIVDNSRTGRKRK